MRIGWPLPEHCAAAVAAAALALCVGAAQAAVDVNRADLPTLEAVKGVGPALAEGILAERARAPFADWADLMRRVKGLGAANAKRLSDAGLTVDGATFAPPPPVRGASSSR